MTKPLGFEGVDHSGRNVLLVIKFEDDEFSRFLKYEKDDLSDFIKIQLPLIVAEFCQSEHLQYTQDSPGKITISRHLEGRFIKITSVAILRHEETLQIQIETKSPPHFGCIVTCFLLISYISILALGVLWFVSHHILLDPKTDVNEHNAWPVAYVAIAIIMPIVFLFRHIYVKIYRKFTNDWKKGHFLYNRIARLLGTDIPLDKIE